MKASAAANVVAARERAQQLALAPMARQRRLVERAAEFFLAVEGQDLAREEGEREIRAVRERVVGQVEAARVEAGVAVVAMLGEDEPVGAVAQRLGLRRADVLELRRLVRAQEPGREAVREPGTPGVRGGVARPAAGPGAGSGAGAAGASDAGGGAAGATRPAASGGAGRARPAAASASRDGSAPDMRGRGAGAV
ncbi:hypothetical protein JCM4814A_00150 [Streptomyces phaeofaciens JCM 4814]|uniref:Uncharacterized protein n=1 Tax=Streptomyces phaeofaciens TaxID=68254 RepID=A0A918HR09_9ACTN|nr:hypothetical protein GCM10010226_88200 [Streptomyces phaeofaciens]